jgi:hypothetical protein
VHTILAIDEDIKVCIIEYVIKGDEREGGGASHQETKRHEEEGSE